MMKGRMTGTTTGPETTRVILLGGVLNRCTYGCGLRSAWPPIGLRSYALID